ncbi:uncharacterized protein B0H64DRAFT_413539 [Chaetomium fimeti]|uniref:Uncharacterized protein n=1 Tax=Chaetomium fimeti TaxID=1854472 RepID=A0AAE0LMI4_9PEZI|nr:hypothetical protein B0H64DRAFT_413539 [Chaetomium fimeti]
MDNRPTIAINRRRNRVASKIRNPANTSRFTINHNIRPFLNKLREEAEFKSKADAVRWLKSDEVFPYWREFKRDCLQYLPQIRAKFSYHSPVTRRYRLCVLRARGLLSSRAVSRVLGDERLAKKLRRSVSNKTKWSFNCHVAWFVSRVYYRCWEAKRDAGTLYPPAYWAGSADDGQQPWRWVEVLADVLMTLSMIEERQPGWGEVFGEEED